MANDILNHPNFVRKNLCNSFSDRTVQRFYKFNTSLAVSGGPAQGEGQASGRLQLGNCGLKSPGWSGNALVSRLCSVRALPV